MDKKELETMVEFMYNKCLRCVYKDKCPKKDENIEELETSLAKIKNDNLQEIEKLTGITA